MYKRRFLFPLSVFLTLLITACNTTPPAPTAAEVFEKVSGAYCSEGGYRLELKQDSTFYTTKVTFNDYSNAVQTRKCKGSYRFEWNEESETWTLKLKKSDRTKYALESCTGDMPIWSREKGWIVGDSIVKLTEMYDGAMVTKGSCEI